MSHTPAALQLDGTIGQLMLGQIGPRRYAFFPGLLHQPGLRHAFATRPDDVSAREDARREERAHRRRDMAGDLGFDPLNLCHCVQVHQTRVAIVDASRPCGAFEGCDSLITNRPGVPLMAFSADCPLILLYDPHAPAVGLVHASWRCTVEMLVTRAIDRMRAAFGCNPVRMLAGIGPSAGPEQYEVKQDVYAAAAGLPERDRYFPRRGGRMFFDLWEANRAQLLAAGLQPKHIELAAVCTMTHTDVFYSYRREGAGCGHFGLMAGLAPATCDARPTVPAAAVSAL